MKGLVTKLACKIKLEDMRNARVAPPGRVLRLLVLVPLLPIGKDPVADGHGSNGIDLVDFQAGLIGLSGDFAVAVRIGQQGQVDLILGDGGVRVIKDGAG